MREIKFRAWDKWKSEYVYSPVAYAIRLLEVEHNNTEITPIGFLPDIDGLRFVLEQFTGLHDKNGVEIYEGDIIVGNNNIKYGGDGTYPTRPDKVMFANGAFVAYSRDLHTAMNDSCTPGSIEVIGNIHENPGMIPEVVV